jgi:hypothetical protein
MDTKTAEKLEYILSGTGTSEEEKNEIIDLMDEYAQKQVKLFAIPDVIKSVCNHKFYWREPKVKQCRLCGKVLYNQTDL